MKNKKSKLLFLILCLLAFFINNKIENNYIKTARETLTTTDVTVSTIAIPSSTSTILEEVMVDRVVDGDTIIVVNSKEESFRVRFIGMDTPESVNPDTAKNSEEGVIASDYTKERLLKGSTIYLQYDIDKYDIYNRTLAYIWLTDDVDVLNNDDVRSYMYNAELILKGYAVPKVYEPNDAYADLFELFYQEIK